MKPLNKILRPSLIGLAISCVSASTFTWAELEEIVVTAQKRAENQQDVPIAITAFTANTLESTGIFSTEDIGNFTPGLQVGRSFNSASYFMRGIGAQANSQPGYEGSVATYVDGVYYNHGADVVDAFNNVERVEVLKGPQGTLFGRNTTGGVVHIITKDPTQDTQLKVGAKVGSADMYGGNFYGSTGLSENIAADLAVTFQRMDDGYGTNLFSGKPVGMEEYTNVRAKVFITPNDQTAIKLTASWGEYMNSGAALNCSSEAEFDCAAGSSATSDYQDINQNLEPGLENDRWVVQARIEHSFEHFEFLSITAAKESDSIQYTDQDTSPLSAVNAYSNVLDTTYSQEIQLQSNDDSVPYQWTAGFYYWDDDSEYNPLILNGVGIRGGPVVVNNSTQTKSYAVFFEGSYEVTEKTKIIAGVRWTSDERDISGTTDFGAIPSRSFQDDESWNEATWRLSLDHQLNEEMMIYASYNRGFKSGIYNSGVVTGIVADPVEPETVDAYEIGMKGGFLDNQLRLNVSAYQYDYKNIQLTTFDQGVAQLLNAAQADIKGLELDGEAVITDSLRVRFGASYLDATYDEFAACEIYTPSPAALGPLGAGNIRTTGDCSGADLIRSPGLTYNVGLLYEWNTDHGLIDAALNAAYTGDFYWEPDNRMEQDAYTVVNADLTWTSVSGKYKVRLYGRNLADEEYALMGIEHVFGDAELAAPPRTFGVAFNATFF